MSLSCDTFKTFTPTPVALFERRSCGSTSKRITYLYHPVPAVFCLGIISNMQNPCTQYTLHDDDRHRGTVKYHLVNDMIWEIFIHQADERKVEYQIRIYT